MPGTRKLGRTTDHRRAMLRAMVTYLLENGKIETTVMLFVRIQARPPHVSGRVGEKRCQCLRGSFH